MLQYLKKSYRTVFLISAIDNKRIDGANDTAKLPVYTTATYSLVTRATKISNAQKQPPDEKLVLSQCGINSTIQIHQSCVIIWFCHIQLNNCVFLQQSSAADVHWQYFSFVFGISQSSHVSLVILGCPVVDHLTIITLIDNIGKLYGQKLTYLHNL